MVKWANGPRAHFDNIKKSWGQFGKKPKQFPRFQPIGERLATIERSCKFNA